MPVDHTQILHASLLVDDRFKHDNTLDARLLGQRWIGWLNLTDQVRLLHVTADANSLRWLWCSRGWRRRRRCNGCGGPTDDAANHTTDLAAGNASWHAADDPTDSRVRWRTFINNHLDLFRNFHRCTE